MLSLAFSPLISYAGAFWEGAKVTAGLSASSFVVGTVVGIAGGIIFVGATGIRVALLVINDAIRAVPTLVMIFFVYFLPYRELFGVTPPDAFLSAMIALIISQAAYTADLVYAAYQTVSPKLVEAGRALGLSEFVILWKLILPDIARQIAAPEMAFFIGIVRLSSIASVIGVTEVVFVAQASISHTLHSLEPWLVVTVIYIIMVTPLLVLARLAQQSKWLRRRF